MQVISVKELQKRLKSANPNNSDRSSGFALVNVLPREEYLVEHIPFSLNIPPGQEKEFEKRFDRSKEIIVYSESEECPVARQVALVLMNMGYTNVREFDAGAQGWREHTEGDSSTFVEHGGSSTVFEMSIA